MTEARHGLKPHLVAPVDFNTKRTNSTPIPWRQFSQIVSKGKPTFLLAVAGAEFWGAGAPEPLAIPPMWHMSGAAGRLRLADTKLHFYGPCAIKSRREGLAT